MSGDIHDPFDTGADQAWILDAVGFDPLRESSLQSRFTVSNGFLGVRGGRAISRGERGVLAPLTFVAGLFDTSVALGSPSGLVSAADWLRVRISVSEPQNAPVSDDVSRRRQFLDMRRGLLISESRPESGGGLVGRLRTLRLVSLSDRAIGLQVIRFEVEEGEGDVILDASFEGVDVGLVSERLEDGLGVWRTQTSGMRLAMAAATALQRDGRELEPSLHNRLTWSWAWRAHAGQVVDFQRIVAVTRAGVGEAEPAAEAIATLERARRRGSRTLIAEHEAAWAERWRRSDLRIEGDPDAEKALRFALYHLNSAANPSDDRVSVGARALTGDDYLGHVFWDTEIFLLPFYSLTWPEAARALLTYRHRTLGAARAKAARMGWRGALYAWESADTGDEVTPTQLVGPDRKVIDILTGSQEQHISADVAYAVWQYWLATADETFLLALGAEILLETGRFWASRAQLEPDGHRHIRGVIGPDEYHLSVDDNAFTNGMARWNIARAMEVAVLLRSRWPERWRALSTEIGLDDAELLQWSIAADQLVTGLDPRTGLFEQFEGYFALEEIDLAAYAGRSVPMDVVLGRERTARSQVIKQADVVALLALLPGDFPALSGVDNFYFYGARCGHGSSLSRAMHGLVAARLGDTELALRHFRLTAATDLTDTHVALAGGVHIAAQGGLWMTAVFGFAGVRLCDNCLAMDPHLPKDWDSLTFPIQWRGRQLRIAITQADRQLVVSLESGPALTLRINGQMHAIGDEGRLKVTYAPEIRQVDGTHEAAPDVKLSASP